MEEVIIPEKQDIALDTAFSCRGNFQEIYDIGKMFATSSLIPANYQGKPMDCTIAVEMANRMGVSPMMVMQNLYVVKGVPSWSGQACMSLIRASGEYKDVRHVYFGEKNADSWGCKVVATKRKTGETEEGPEVTIKIAKEEGWYSKPGSKWKTMPELMLAYRAAAFFARTKMPEVLMGCRVEGEAEDMQPAAPPKAVDAFAGQEVVE